MQAMHKPAGGVDHRACIGDADCPYLMLATSQGDRRSGTYSFSGLYGESGIGKAPYREGLKVLNEAAPFIFWQLLLKNCQAPQTWAWIVKEVEIDELLD